MRSTPPVAAQTLTSPRYQLRAYGCMARTNIDTLSNRYRKAGTCEAVQMGTRKWAPIRPLSILFRSGPPSNLQSWFLVFWYCHVGERFKNRVRKRRKHLFNREGEGYMGVHGSRSRYIKAYEGIWPVLSWPLLFCSVPWPAVVLSWPDLSWPV